MTDIAFSAAPLPPIHPGEMLREDYMIPFGLTAYTLAKRLGVPRTRIERIVREELGISAETALRLARFFGSTPQFWLNLQSSYELSKILESAPADLESIEPLSLAS